MQILCFSSHDENYSKSISIGNKCPGDELMICKKLLKEENMPFFPCNIHALITGAWPAFWHGGVTDLTVNPT